LLSVKLLICYINNLQEINLLIIVKRYFLVKND